MTRREFISLGEGNTAFGLESPLCLELSIWPSALGLKVQDYLGVEGTKILPVHLEL